jgi:DNA mismatch endonuclease Vsr
MTQKRGSYENVAPSTRRRMQAVRSSNTSPEIVVRKQLHSLGYRFRLHRKDLPGTPDIVLPKHNKIVLVHGCFWHGHSACRRATLPANNSETWQHKIKMNQARDGRCIAALSSLGWSVLVVWECEIANMSLLRERLSEFLTTPHSPSA